MKGTYSYHVINRLKNTLTHDQQTTIDLQPQCRFPARVFGAAFGRGDRRACVCFPVFVSEFFQSLGMCRSLRGWLWVGRGSGCLWARLRLLASAGGGASEYPGQGLFRRVSVGRRVRLGAGPGAAGLLAGLRLLLGWPVRQFCRNGEPPFAGFASIGIG